MTAAHSIYLRGELRVLEVWRAVHYTCGEKSTFARAAVGALRNASTLRASQHIASHSNGGVVADTDDAHGTPPNNLKQQPNNANAKPHGLGRGLHVPRSRL